MPPPQVNESGECEKFIDLVKGGKFDRSELSKISLAIGEAINADVTEDIDGICELHKDPENLTNYDSTLWLKERNPVIVSFLMSIANVKSLDDNPEKSKCLAAPPPPPDCLYKARNLRLVTWLHIARNLITYHVSGSE